mmetsp:Transcript_139144/g.312921  ORF Transcript_139144/g.312921 Transcript_139144/m.312921 type:complete len:167 (-) Transcript_139144:252-752(-)
MSPQPHGHMSPQPHGHMSPQPHGQMGPMGPVPMGFQPAPHDAQQQTQFPPGYVQLDSQGFAAPVPRFAGMMRPMGPPAPGPVPYGGPGPVGWPFYQGAGPQFPPGSPIVTGSLPGTPRPGALAPTDASMGVDPVGAAMSADARALTPPRGQTRGERRRAEEKPPAK